LESIFFCWWRLTHWDVSHKYQLYASYHFETSMRTTYRFDFAYLTSVFEYCTCMLNWNIGFLSVLIADMLGSCWGYSLCGSHTWRACMDLGSTMASWRHVQFPWLKSSIMFLHIPVSGPCYMLLKCACIDSLLRPHIIAVLTTYSFSYFQKADICPCAGTRSWKSEAHCCWGIS
jgi:hypothetical protein